MRARTKKKICDVLSAACFLLAFLLCTVGVGKGFVTPLMALGLAGALVCFACIGGVCAARFEKKEGER